MRKLLISAAVIAFSIFPALAQPDHDHGHGGGTQAGPAPQAPHGGLPGGGGAPGRGGGGPPSGGHFEHGGPAPNPSYSRGPNGGGFNHAMPGANPAYTRGANGGGDFHHDVHGGRPENPGAPTGGFNRPTPGANPAYTRGANGGDVHHDFRDGRPGGFNPGGPNMAGRPGGFHGGPPGHHDFHGFGDFHQNFSAPRHFHAGTYRRPEGWYPHHWMFGEFLPTAFWARDYWLLDYMDFGLPPPPYGAVWVRVGDDALLIDQDTGEIITVEYGVFY